MVRRYGEKVKREPDDCRLQLFLHKKEKIDCWQTAMKINFSIIHKYTFLSACVYFSITANARLQFALNYIRQEEAQTCNFSFRKIIEYLATSSPLL